MKKTLINFQANAAKSYSKLGFSADLANTVFGIIINIRNLCKAAEAADSVLMHKYMGVSMWYLANFCEGNFMSLADCIEDNYDDMSFDLLTLELEDFLQQIQNEMTFISERSNEDKKQFVQKCWVTIFDEDYHANFIKIERILSRTIEDEKIKHPESFVVKTEK